VRTPYLRDQSGSVAVIFALALTMLIGVAAIVVDLGHAYVVRREMQKAAEAGANAGVRALALPDNTSFPNWNNALNIAKAMVQGNNANGAPSAISTRMTVFKRCRRASGISGGPRTRPRLISMATPIRPIITPPVLIPIMSAPR
jgi:Flp pilus assembly protein TadG